MQLIKLAYIAHGFSLAINNRPLLNEHIEAWRYGPVVPGLYHRLKKFGSSPVTEEQPVSVFERFGQREELDPEDQALIDAVFAKYGKLSGVQLSHLTHRQGTPWFESYEPGVFGVEMDDAQIKVHYATLLSGGRSS